MGSYNRKERSGSERGGRGFDREKTGGRGFKGGRKDYGDKKPGGRPAMFSATCKQCGKDCEVPFRPTGSRPIFCSTCFDKQEKSGASRMGEKSYQTHGSGDRGLEQLQRQVELMNAKLDKILKAIDTPVFDDKDDEMEYKRASRRVKKGKGSGKRKRA